MKKLLPLLFVGVFALVVLLLPSLVSAQGIGPGRPNPIQQLQPNQNASSSAQPQPENSSIWVIDPEVTFIGKNAARAGVFLDWTLKNYNWVCVNKVNERQCDDSNNPIAKYWSLIVLYIVVPLLFVVILFTSAIIIITRGKSLTIMRFIPRFVAVVLLIVFSYSLLQFFYQFTDLIQGFFLRSDINKPCPPDCIQQTDLLYVGWKYKTFIGLRLLGDQNAESAFISLLLTKLTALTYFVMVFLLLVRKIILWFFIIVSPIFPILLLFYPVRNTGKIWIGEFFRWLLYAPLFAIFLNGLVYLWKNQIPLVFVNPNIGNASQIVFPTAVNILLGGPRQFVTPTNSVNLVETFALYVVSLIMLWIVILLPWILLQIFLDYASNFAPGDTAVMKTLVNMASNRPSQPGGGGGSQPPSQGGGATLNLPFSKKFSIPKDLQNKPAGEAKEIKIDNATLSNATFNKPAFIPNATVNTVNVATNVPTSTNVPINTAANIPANAEVLTLAKVKLPTMRDIAKYDTALTSRSQTKLQDVAVTTQALISIANPAVSTVDKEQYTEIREKIVEKSQQGNIMASSILNAAKVASQKNTQVSNQQVKESLKQMANPASAPNTNRDKMSRLNNMLQKESSTNNNQIASKILKVSDKTSDKEIESLKNNLSATASSHVSKSVNSAISHDAQATTKIKDVLKQVAAPVSGATAPGAKSAAPQQVTKLRGTLEKASKEGNQLATSILKVNDKTSADEIVALQKKIQEAKAKGEPVATEVAALAEQTAALPTVNRVQTVSKEDYQAVRDMWKQNYQNLEVPQGMAGTRAEWIKDDIASIDETIGLLSSSDQDKVEEGMEQVSNLMPFLMMGGFSQTEIVDYLKAKQDAAKDISQVLTKEEEEQVTVGTKHVAAEGHLEATLEDDEKSPEQKAKEENNAEIKPEGQEKEKQAEDASKTPTVDKEPEDPMDKVEAVENDKNKPENK